MTVKEIIEEYLKRNGYEGLWSEEECGCPIEDLFPCEECPGNCQPGYKLPGNEEYDFFIGPEKYDPNRNLKS